MVLRHLSSQWKKALALLRLEVAPVERHCRQIEGGGRGQGRHPCRISWPHTAGAMQVWIFCSLELVAVAHCALPFSNAMKLPWLWPTNTPRRFGVAKTASRKANVVCVWPFSGHRGRRSISQSSSAAAHQPGCPQHASRGPYPGMYSGQCIIKATGSPFADSFRQKSSCSGSISNRELSMKTNRTPFTTRDAIMGSAPR